MSLIMITDDTMKKLKCDLCNNYLSYFPIFMSNGKNICGRFWLHHPQEESNLYVDKAFESLAELIEFPCQYKKEGCIEKCFPKDVIEHEIECSYRIVKCPSRHISPCNWEGALPIVLDHCKNIHNDLMLKNGHFEINLAESHQRENLFEHDFAVFLVSQNFTSLNKLMEINIRYPDYVYNNKENFWNITFETTNRKVKIRMDTQTFEGHNNAMVYFDSLINDSDLSDMAVKGKIMLDKNIKNKQEFSEEKNNEFLALFKCSSCSNYALPPIYEITMSNSQMDKNIQCSECRSKLINNLNQNSTVQEVRNYALDKIAEKLTFPCENEVNGCTFKSKPLSVGNHCLSCLYRKYNCPVNEYRSCNWKGIVFDLPNHIEQVHSDMILKSSNVIEKFTYNITARATRSLKNKKTCHILNFLNRYFFLIFFHKREEFHWVVQRIDGNLSNDHFKYEVEITSTKNKYKCLRTRHSCLRRLDAIKKAILKRKKCCFNYTQLRHFFVYSNGAWHLNFNVKIFT